MAAGWWMPWLPDNGNRTSTGWFPAGSPAGSPLTTWLADEIDALAGRMVPRGQDSDPLTFGDLWRGPGGTGSPEDGETNLSPLCRSGEGRTGPRWAPLNRTRVR
jgi:hypothetical protein